MNKKVASRSRTNRFFLRSTTTKWLGSFAIILSILAMSAQAQIPTGNTVVELVPIGSTGPVTSLSGSSIEIPGGADDGSVVVELELRVSGWATTGDGLLQSVQATIDGSGYCSGVGDPLNPLGYPGAPVLTCPQGNGCPTDGDTCNQGGFYATKRCTVGFASPPTGAPCDVARDCPGEFCLDDPSAIFCPPNDWNPVSPVSFPSLSYEFVCVNQFGGRLDAGLAEAFGTLLVEVPAGALGSYTIGFVADSDQSFSGDGAANTFALGSLNPATITLSTGSCCYNFGPGTTKCMNNVTMLTCDAQVQPSHFRQGEQCGANTFPDSGNGSDCDNCPFVDNVDQSDVDGDGIGDLCDNCLLGFNQDQADGDGDDIGNICDNCPDLSNTDQSNLDGDIAGDVCDECPNDSNKVAPGICGCGRHETMDSDGDGIIDCVDECMGADDAIFGNCTQNIPTVSEWGLVVLSLLLLVGGKLYFGRSRAVV